MGKQEKLNQVIVSYFDYENGKITLEDHLENIKEVAITVMLDFASEDLKRK